MQITQPDTTRGTGGRGAGTPTTARTPLLVGLALTVLAAAAALLDPVTTGTVAGHVRDAYPQWDAGTVRTEQTAIIGWLAGTSLLGTVGWFSTLWAARRGRRWTFWCAATWFALGLLTAGLTLGTGGEAYDVIVPTPLGLVSALPLVAGAVALWRLWRDRATAQH